MDSLAHPDWLEALSERARLDLLGDLAGGLAHELNNALSVVRGHQDLLLEALEQGHGESPEALCRRARTVQLWTDNALAVARRLYEASRHLRDDRQPTEAAPLIAEAVDLCRYRCQREGIVVVCQQAAGTARVAASPRRLLQMVVALLQNAREAIGRHPGEPGQPEHGTIHVASRCRHTILRLVVEDDGPGVPAERLEEIFLPGVSAKAGPGCGYGLPVARHLAERCGGSLRAEAGPMGRFVLDLPLSG